MSLALRIAPQPSAGTEQELVAAVRGGDDRSFEELYVRYRKRIARYVLGMVGDHGRAEDITQDVFISALRRMRDTERAIAFKPWIYEIAKNACIDHARRMRPGREQPLGVEDDESTALRPLSSADSVEGAVEAKQRLNDLRGAFGCLSESHHQILVMRELEGLTYKQIGERMGMSRPVVESTLFRARRRLGEEYEELVSGRRCEHVQAVVSDPDTRALGIRERRRLARHLAHCQPCRRHAHLAGFDDSVLKPTTLAGKIAALLPLPLVRLREVWRPGGTPRGGNGVSRLQTPGMLRSADTVLRAADPSGASIGFGRAAAAVAALALTGAGGGILVNGSGRSTAHRAPAPAALVAPVGHVRPPTAGGAQRLRRRGAPPGPGGAARATPSGATPAAPAASAHGGVGAPPSAPSSPGNPSSNPSSSGSSAGAGGSGSRSAPAASGAGSASPASGAASAGAHSPGPILPSLPVQLPSPPAVANVQATAGSLPVPPLPKLPSLPSPPPLPQLPQQPQLPKLSPPPVSVPGVVGGLLPHGHG